uniref:Uncharacterized protein n=1 Tax=Parascaris univalens TaxID=6257 RepID=A0A915A0Y7_PARUN
MSSATMTSTYKRFSSTWSTSWSMQRSETFERSWLRRPFRSTSYQRKQQSLLEIISRSRKYLACIPNVHSSTTSGLPSSSLNSSLKAQRSSINEAGRCISSTMNRSSGESQNRSSNETAADDTQLRGNVHAIDHFTVVRSFEECIRYLNMSHFSLK